VKLLLALSFLLVCAAPSFAKDEPEAKTPPDAKAETAKPADHPPEEPKLSVTEHSVMIGGKPVKYKAVAGYLVLKDEIEDQPDKEGKKEAAPDEQKDPVKAKAKIFFIAYTREGVDVPGRPVTFAFNGGPGAASVWLHLGALGPRRVKLAPVPEQTSPPYQLVDNDSSWLDDTDLVFIDPVSTGYSRPVPGESAKPFHGFEGDIKSVASFIRLYTTRYNRWLSPKFIVGESYGGTRAAALSTFLQDRYNIYLNGIVIVSGLLNWQTAAFSSGNNLPYILALPTEAATAWYHKKLSPSLQAKTVDEVRSEAESFASGDYLHALEQGSALPDDARKQIAGRISELTGVPVEFILRFHLRFPSQEFEHELLKSENRTVGRFDTCFTGIGYDPKNMGFDPSFEAVKGAFTATINDYLRTDLKFESDLPYETLANVEPWDFSNVENQFLDVSDNLGEAMSENPHLKVWVTLGCYDLAVPYYGTDYTLRQMPIDPVLRPNIRITRYETGHMIYTHEDALVKLKADFDAFLHDAVPH